MSEWNFKKQSHKPDTDWGPEQDSGMAIQPDHYPNVARPGGGYPEGKGHKTDATCNKCGDQLVDGSCQRCDWGPQNRSVPVKNFPLDPFEDDKAGIRAGSWKFADSEFSPRPSVQKNWWLWDTNPEELQEIVSEHPEDDQSYWDMSVSRGEIPVPHAETKPENYQRPRPEHHQPKEEDPAKFDAPIPEWRRKLMTLYPEIAGMSEEEVANYFKKEPIKKLFKVRNSKEIKLEDPAGPILSSEYGPNDWHYRYDPSVKAYYVEWPAQNSSTPPLSKEELERWLGTLRAEDAEREGQLSLNIQSRWNF